MQTDFHYYATYCAAFIAGYDHEQSLAIGYSSQFCDWCTRTLLSKLGAPVSAATTQLQLELLDAKTDISGLQDITRIWASFHFLPGDLYAKKSGCGKRYLDKYRLICKPNGELVSSTVKLAKGKSLQAAGIAMHVLADTWAHQNFAGTPSLVINNVNHHFYEIITTENGEEDILLSFKNNPFAPDDTQSHTYIRTIYQPGENSIMNLGHGRAGHLPDYSFARYKYLPSWADYEEFLKDNPKDYFKAFCQMVHALKFLKGTEQNFSLETYDENAVEKWRHEIKEMLCARTVDACDLWKAFAEKLSGEKTEDFDIEKYQQEYTLAENKDETFLGSFFLAAMSQKSMVTHSIYKSGNRLAGISVEYAKQGFKGIKDFEKLVNNIKQEEDDE